MVLQEGLHTSLFHLKHFLSCACLFENKVSAQKLNNNIRDNGHLTRSLH